MCCWITNESGVVGSGVLVMGQGVSAYREWERSFNGAMIGISGGVADDAAY
jgi:hypothetical protein